MLAMMGAAQMQGALLLLLPEGLRRVPAGHLGQSVRKAEQYSLSVE